MINIPYKIVPRKSDADSVVLKMSSSVIPKSVQTRCFMILYQLKMKSVRELDQKISTVAGALFSIKLKNTTKQDKLEHQKTNWRMAIAL